jgi:hypothetical protein
MSHYEIVSKMSGGKARLNS